jgi:hypothetical protein
MNPSDVESIYVFNGNTGESFTIDDEEKITYIVENIKSVEMRRDKLSIGYSGYTYRLTFIRENGSEIDSFVMNSKNTIRDNPFFYTSDDDLCFEYIKELEEEN